LLRLSLYGGVVFFYWLYHVSAIQGAMGANATYRMAVNWEMILSNLRMLPLMTIRIFYLAGYKIEWTSYFQNTASTIGGVTILLVTCAGWYLLLRNRTKAAVAGLLFLAWTAVFLIIPIYSGGQIWHVTAPACGYGALFGIGAAALIASLHRPLLRLAAPATCMLGLLVLGIVSLNNELHKGIFAIPSLLTRDLLVHPPIPPDKLGPNASIYMEDRMNLGGWPYGCYGRLMRYIYQRVDIREVIVAPGALTPAEYATLRRDPHAHYVVYDSNYRWRDATAEMRSDLRVTPLAPDIKTADPVQFSAIDQDSHTQPATWSMEPALGSIDTAGRYTPPEEVTAADERTLAIAPALATAPHNSGLRLVAGTPEAIPIRMTANATSDVKQSGTTVVKVNVVRPESVEWSVDPANGGWITQSGYFQPAPGAEPRAVTIKATSLRDRSRTATAKVLTGAPWQTLDIGTVAEPGAFRSGETLEIRGSGDIVGTADAFRYVLQTLDGNGTITARVSTPAIREYTKAGLMIRESLSPQSRHVFAGIISGKTSFIENRPQPFASTAVEFGRSNSPWLRLERKGDTFSAYTSADGDRWEPIGKPFNLRMAPRIFVGFAVSSGNHSLANATLANVRLLSGTGAVSAMQ
jgi:regulation of enolase protein 1 (concanavalin A-like superfamily)